MAHKPHLTTKCPLDARLEAMELKFVAHMSNYQSHIEHEAVMVEHFIESQQSISESQAVNTVQIGLLIEGQQKLISDTTGIIEIWGKGAIIIKASSTLGQIIKWLTPTVVALIAAQTYIAKYLS